MPPVAAAFAAVGTALGAAAGTSAVLAGISAVGTGLSVIGKITGNEKMMKFGGVMGLVGGVGSLVNSAFGAAGAAGAAEGVVGAAELAGEGAIDLGLQGAAEAAVDLAAFGGSTPSWAGASESLTSGLEVASAATDLSDIASMPSFSDARFEAQRGGLLNATVPQLPQSTVAPDVTAQGSSSTGYQGSAQQRLDNQFLKSDYGYTGSADASTAAGRKSFWDKLSPHERAAIIQGGLGAIGGLFDGWTEEQKLALQRELAQRSQQNANAQPIVKFQPVAGVSSRPMGGLLYAQKG